MAHICIEGGKQMKRWIFFGIGLIVALGCDSENTKTYELNGYWTLSGEKNLCSQFISEENGGGSLTFEEIVVKVYKSEEAQEAGEVYRETTVPCKNYSFTVEDIERGTYWVNVAAMAPDPPMEIDIDGGVDMDDTSSELRAYYEKTQEVVIPSKDEEKLVEFELKIGTGSIEVTWKFEDGQCKRVWSEIENGWVEVATVSIEVVGKKKGSVYSSGEIECAETQWKVEDLDWDVYTVTVKGYDDKGKNTYTGAFDNPVEIRPGTHIDGKDGFVTLMEN